MYDETMNNTTNQATRPTYDVAELHEELTQVLRHGYVVYTAADTIAAWTLNVEDANAMLFAHEIVNPQNAMGLNKNYDLKELQGNLAQVKRHGYATFSKAGILLAWTMSSRAGFKIAESHHVVNVQNGAYFEI